MLAYCVTSLPLAGFWVTILTVALVLGGVLVVLWVGLPLLAFALAVARAAARSERGRCAALLGRTVPSPRYRSAGGPSGWRAAARRAATDPATARDVGYLVLLVPLGIVDLVLAVGSVVAPLATLTYPAWWWALPPGEAAIGSLGLDSWPRAVAVFAAGTVLAVAAVWTLRHWGRLRAAVVARLLGPSRSVLHAEQVERLAEERKAVVRGRGDELRRVERDLHDGAQTRLVALGIELGLARRSLAAAIDAAGAASPTSSAATTSGNRADDTVGTGTTGADPGSAATGAGTPGAGTTGADPGSALALLDRAQDLAEAALADLRAVVRGIAPPELATRGLGAAVASVAT
ncbi:MAG: sensor domain-containing protein, partial [Phycicoccus sp.]